MRRQNTARKGNRGLSPACCFTTYYAVRTTAFRTGAAERLVSPQYTPVPLQDRFPLASPGRDCVQRLPDPLENAIGAYQPFIA
jgi:hypothetical protein